MSIDKKRAELLDTDRRRKELEDKRTQLAQERKRKEDQGTVVRHHDVITQLLKNEKDVHTKFHHLVLHDFYT